MQHIEKLSEKGLYHILNTAYPKSVINCQKRIKVLDKVMIVDYEVIYNNHVIYFEFDGPTHYTSSSTQRRDILLGEYCDIMDITLVRMPYFIQLNSNTQPALLPYCSSKYMVDSEYVPGFHDAKIVYPGNFNSYGWSLFSSQYLSYDATTQNQIKDSLVLNKELELTLGVDYLAAKRLDLFR